MTDLCKTMGSPAELTLDCRPSPGKYSSALKAISLVSDQFERVRQLDDYLKGLEEERKKIEAFKRELPFCMHLLNDAIAASKEQLADCQIHVQASTPTNQMVFSYEEQQYMPASSDSRPVLEEFIPLKKPCDESGEESEVNHSHHDSKRTKFDNGEKPNWMSSAQLWSQNSESEECKEEQRVSPQEKPLKPHDSHSGRSGQEQVFASNSKLFPDSKQRTGGAFLPFSRERQSNPAVSVRSDAGKTLPDLALSSGEQEVGSSLRCNEMAKLNNATTTTFRSSKSKEPTETATPVISKEGSAKPNVGGCSPAPTTSNGAQSGGQSQRKARRCWSPELHRRFVSALQQLGGSQVATPKQIRELMKVDGLTNDEVKSHLQKYRLHTRRPSPSPQTSASQAPQLVVLGGIWVPPDYAAAAAHQAPGLYSPLSNTTTSHSQSHYCQSPMPQEYYSQANQSSQLQRSQLTYCEQHHTPSQSLSSPQGPLQLTGQSSGARGTSADGGREESVGDGKSESSSWKGEENGQNGEATNMGSSLSLRKPLQSVDGDDEDSRGSETALKF
ncbi:hypothetical protein SUGI_0608570 [Cryptomeria japonica]|uniref:myb family transcription factor EFM isoform X2 n=1 Tax=Cryptomeria japonica TaxID=3369 RepID=UPI0024149188|nr:myb family transcription factor EFM isoform X2 [Cryptomeria japonica]GLJ30708.1 hypothetical protein SUGI_0608570 [Cryptomeria japonica]